VQSSPADAKQKGGLARRELDIAEQVLLQVEQMTKRLAHDAELLGMSPKTCDLLLKKLDARLTPDMIKAYSAGWDGSNTRGMDVLDRLKQARERYGKVCELISAMHASRDSPLASHESLEAILRRVREDFGIEVAGKADECVLVRMVNDALGQDDFDKIKLALDGESEMMKRLGSEAAAMQGNIIQKNIIDMCREADGQVMDSAEAQLISYIRVLASIVILDKNFAIEVSRLHALARLAGEQFTMEEYPQLQAQKDEFMSKKAGVFYKAFALLPTGSRISTNAARVVDKMLQDKSCEMVLATLKSNLSSLPAPVLSQLVQQGQFVIPNKPRWVEAAALHAQVATAASDRFRALHATALQEVVDKFQTLQSSISMATISQVEGMLKDFHAKLAEATSAKPAGAGAATNPDETATELQGSLEKVMGFLRMAREADFHDALSKEAAASISASIEAKLVTIEKVAALLPWLMQYVCNGTADVAAESALWRLERICSLSCGKSTPTRLKQCFHVSPCRV
jgi:hypothetical protein